MFSQLGNILDSKLNRQSNLGKQLEIVKIFDLYKRELSALPPALNNSIPVSLQNKILTVQVPSAAQASELRLREEKTIRNINHVLGKEVIKRIIYRF